MLASTCLLNASRFQNNSRSMRIQDVLALLIAIEHKVPYFSNMKYAYHLKYNKHIFMKDMAELNGLVGYPKLIFLYRYIGYQLTQSINKCVKLSSH